MKNVIIIIILLLFVSCDPGYRVIIINKSTNDISLITDQPIESNIFNKQSAEYISLMKMKEINQDNTVNSNGYYKIPSG